MTGYLIRRGLQAIIVLLVVTFVTFGLLHLMPGGPAAALLGTRATQQEIRNLNHQLGFDRAIPIQYWNWLKGLLQGNLGFSYKREQSVSSLLGATVPKTLVLLVEATIIAVAIAIPLGVVQAVRRNSFVDYMGTGIAWLLYSTPVYFLGLLSLLIFADNLNWFGAQAPATTGDAILPYITDWHDMFLPVMTLALPSVAIYSRYVRSSVLDQLTQDYVRTAIAKGANQRRVMYRHVLRNSLIPMVTLLGYSLPALFSGAFITEIVFNLQGLGMLTLNSATQFDYATLLGLTVLVAAATVVGSLLADLGYAALDPRVRLTD